MLRYYENEILEDSEQSTMSALKEEPFAEVVLLEDVAYFEWEALDGRLILNGEGLDDLWEDSWESQGRLPLLIRLTMATGAKGEEIRQVFWIPPRLNPEVVMRQMTQGADQNQNPNLRIHGGQNNGDESGNPPELEINPGEENPLEQ